MNDLNIDFDESVSIIFWFSGSFEITLNDMLLFSKLESGGFPVMDKVNKYYLMEKKKRKWKRK